MKRRTGWWRRRPRPRRDGGTERESAASTRRETITFWAVLAGSAAAVLVVVWAALAFLVGWTGDLFGGDGEERIEIRRVVIGNEEEDYNSLGPLGEQTRASTPQLNIPIRNFGDDDVLLETAVVAVKDSARFPNCVPPQGGGPSPHTKYVITLPPPPTPADLVVRRPILYEVPAGGAGYPQLLFGPRTDPGEVDYLYALHVHLLTGDSKRVDVGDYVLALPGSLDRSGAAFPEDNHSLEYLEETYPDDEDRLVQTWCFRRNLATLERLIGRPGDRSPDVAALEQVEMASDWPAFADPRSPREAVEVLLRAEREGPQLAFFAASRTGDPQLVAGTRERAVALLLAAAEEEMYENENFVAASQLARDALALTPSERAEDLLLRAEDGLRDEEEERERTLASEGYG